MGSIQIDATYWRRALYRPLWNGGPGSGKTTGLLTLPRRKWAQRYGRPIAGACHVVVVPGETGFSSVLPEEDFHVHAWEWDAAAPKQEAAVEVYKEVQACIREVIAEKHGLVESLVLDGGHKLYDLIMLVHGWQPSMVDDKESGKQYIKYHAAFRSFMGLLLGSQVPLVGMTVWEGMELSDPENPKSMKLVYPQFPGMMAKECLGMFPLVFHCSKEPAGQASKFLWTVRPTTRMQAAGLHVPVQVARRFPDVISVEFGADGEPRGGTGWAVVERIVAELLGPVAPGKESGS